MEIIIDITSVVLVLMAVITLMTMMIAATLYLLTAIKEMLEELRNGH